MHPIRLLWVEPPDVLRGLEGGTDENTLQRGVIDRVADDGAPGPAGRYRLLPEEIWRIVDPDRPAPVFLHEAYEALLERWVNSLPDAAAEVAIVARVRDAVMQLVETRLAADPRAFSASPTITTTEPTPHGMAIVGRSVVLRPARRALHSPTPAEQRNHRRPGV